MREDFCAFILTHGRPFRVYTYESLIKSGYTGKVYIVCDDEDETLGLYRDNFGDKVLTFSKSAIAETFDEGDNFNDRRAIIYARNACFDLAEQVGCKYFIELDDDYSQFHYKFNAKKTYAEMDIRNLDKILESLLEYFIAIPAASIAMGQNGDFLGGKNTTTADAIKTKRKAMNTFICSTNRKFSFFGRINEDVNTYTCHGRRGGLFLTILQVGLIQNTTQASKGGMTELYRDAGTYVKTFYSIMYCPSSVKIYEMGMKTKRLHHKIDWGCTVPKILAEHHRKPRAISA